MNSFPPTNIIVSILFFVVVISSVVIAPQRANAQGAPTFDLANFLENVFNVSQTTATAIESTISTVATIADEVNTYVLEPLAFIESRDVLKKITSGVLSFVNGTANGTGAPQFVQDVRKNLQTIGDIQTNSFLSQLTSSSNSPFANAIASSLRTSYLQDSSLAGFFASAESTLNQATANVTGFLNGDWSQGGTTAWFALTTQDQNNPYTLYQMAQNQLASLVSSASAARQQELSYGNGFLSWCGSTNNNLPSTQTTTVPPATTTPTTTPSAVANPGDPCTNKDGTPGTIQTPGSVIAAGLSQSLNYQNQKLVGMGNVGPEINSILGDIGSAISIIKSAKQLLGGNGSGGGLAQTQQEVSQGSSQSDFSSLTSSGVIGSFAGTILPNMLSNISIYGAAWNDIATSAEMASTTIVQYVEPAANTYGIQAQAAIAKMIGNKYIIDTQVASDMQAIAAFTPVPGTQGTNFAQQVINNEIAPVLAQAAQASSTIAAAQTMIKKIENEQNSTVAGSQGAFLADVQTLSAMSPTTSDVAAAKQDDQTFGNNLALADPTGSLFVSGSSLLEQMKLLTTNAESFSEVLSKCMGILLLTYEGHSDINFGAPPETKQITDAQNLCSMFN